MVGQRAVHHAAAPPADHRPEPDHLHHRFVSRVQPVLHPDPGRPGDEHLHGRYVDLPDGLCPAARGGRYRDVPCPGRGGRRDQRRPVPVAPREHLEVVVMASVAARTRRVQKKGTRSHGPINVYVIVSVVLSVVFLLPLVWAVLRSFQPPSQITAAPSLKDFTHLTLANYSGLINGNIQILRYVENSLLVATGTAL